jgi:transposase
MLTVDDIEQIRRDYYCEQKSIRAIAREQHHHRRVVREAIAGTSPPPRHFRRQRPRASPTVGPVSQLIDAWLTADQDAPPKQRHTAKRIFDRLAAEYGYAGKERAVREHVHDWKQAHRSDGIGYLPLAHAPGAEAQCDWCEAVVRVAGIEQEAQLFCLRLAYSLRPFVRAFPTARQECFFAGHVSAFQLFGGVPHRISYDNLTSAVQKFPGGTESHRAGGVRRLSRALPVRELLLSAGQGGGTREVPGRDPSGLCPPQLPGPGSRGRV